MSVGLKNTRGSCRYAFRLNISSEVLPCLLEMLPNVLLTLHPQLKNSHSKMSGSRRCPSFIRPTPCLGWRDRALASCATQPSLAVSSLTGRYHELYVTVWDKVAALNHFPLLLLLQKRPRW